jgi:hypothetical protein
LINIRAPFMVLYRLTLSTMIGVKDSIRRRACFKVIVKASARLQYRLVRYEGLRRKA